MNGVNKVILIGHLGADPEIRYTRDGSAVASFRIATTEKWRNKDGEQQERTEWHNVTIFGKLAEVVEQYVKKGDPLYIEGKLTTDKWQDRDGNDRYTTKVVANQMQMLGSKRDGQRPQREDRETSRQSATPRDEPRQGESDSFFDDDIPF